MRRAELGHAEEAPIAHGDTPFVPGSGDGHRRQGSPTEVRFLQPHEFWPGIRVAGDTVSGPELVGLAASGMMLGVAGWLDRGMTTLGFVLHGVLLLVFLSAGLVAPA
jgi:hypothetical protein